MLEKAVVSHFNCDPEQPLCLYDFTIKHVMNDFIAYAVPNLFETQLEGYFYDEDYCAANNRKTRTIDYFERIKKLSEETPQHFEEEFKQSNQKNKTN